MKNKKKSDINHFKNSNLFNNISENNINKNQKKNSKLYLFVFLVEQEVGNSLLIKAFHELNEENQENNILLNKNNSIKIELSEIKILKEIDKIIKSIDGIIFINNFQDEKKLDNNVELIKKIDKKIKKCNSKKFFPKLFIGNRIELMNFFEKKHPNFYKNEVYIFEMPIDRPFTIYSSSEALIKMIQIKDNYAKFLTENKIDEKHFKKNLCETSTYLYKCLNCNNTYKILLEHYSKKIYYKCDQCNMELELSFQEYANFNFNNNVLVCIVCKKNCEKKNLNYCQICKKYICEDCIKKHIQKEYKIKNENYKIYKYRYNLSTFFCNIHTKICNGYCLDCEGNICPECDIYSHLAHDTKLFNNSEILELIKEQKNNLLLEKTNFEKMKEILEDFFESFKEYFDNLLINKKKEFEIKEEIINQLEFFKYDNILIENAKNLEFEIYDLNYDKNDSVDKKINNILKFFNKPKKIKKVNLLTKENLKGPYDILQRVNLKEEDNDNDIEHLTDLCFLNNYMDKNYFAASFNNGLLKVYDDNFGNRVPITIVKEFEVNESINSLEKSKDNSLLLVNNWKIKKIKFSDDYKEYKVINIIEEKEQLFKMAVEIGEINALLTTNDYNHIRIYDFDNGKELYKNYLKDEILFMEKISENKIILQISKNQLMNLVNIDLERNSLFINIDNIDLLNESLNNEINIKKGDEEITLKINEFYIINNEIKLRKDFAFKKGINYLGKIDENLLLLYDKLENQAVLFDINEYESVLKLFFNSSLKPVTSLLINKSIDSFDLLILFEGETLGQCVLNSKLKFINLVSKLKIEKTANEKTIIPTEEKKQKNNNEIKKIISFANDNFLIITKGNLIYNLKNFN